MLRIEHDFAGAGGWQDVEIAGSGRGHGDPRGSVVGVDGPIPESGRRVAANRDAASLRNRIAGVEYFGENSGMILTGDGLDCPICVAEGEPRPIKGEEGTAAHTPENGLMRRSEVVRDLFRSWIPKCPTRSKRRIAARLRPTLITRPPPGGCRFHPPLRP